MHVWIWCVFVAGWYFQSLVSLPCRLPLRLGALLFAAGWWHFLVAWREEFLQEGRKSHVSKHHPWHREDQAMNSCSTRSQGLLCVAVRQLFWGHSWGLGREQEVLGRSGCQLREQEEGVSSIPENAGRGTLGFGWPSRFSTMTMPWNSSTIFSQAAAPACSRTRSLPRPWPNRHLQLWRVPATVAQILVSCSLKLHWREAKSSADSKTHVQCWFVCSVCLSLLRDCAIYHVDDVVWVQICLFSSLTNATCIPPASFWCLPYMSVTLEFLWHGELTCCSDQAFDQM